VTFDPHLPLRVFLSLARERIEVRVAVERKIIAEINAI